MANSFALKSQVLQDGRIDDADFAAIKAFVHADGKVDLDDVRLLVELRCEARGACEAFEDFLFATLREQFLADGAMLLSEQFYLLKMLYADGRIDQREREFLRELQKEVRQPTKDFQELCKEALSHGP